MITLQVEIELVQREDGHKDLSIQVQCFPKTLEPHVTDIECAVANGLHKFILDYIRAKGTKIVEMGGAKLLWEKVEDHNNQQEGTNERYRGDSQTD